MKKMLLALMLVLACGGAPSSDTDLSGHYDVVIVTAPTSPFSIESTTQGSIDLAESAGRLSGTWSWGSSAWNAPSCVSPTPPPGCAPDQTAVDGRHGVVFAGDVGADGCMSLDLRTGAYPGFMTEEIWRGRVERETDGGVSIDFHSGGVCQESVVGFALGAGAQAWAVRR